MKKLFLDSFKWFVNTSHRHKWKLGNIICTNNIGRRYEISCKCGCNGEDIFVGENCVGVVEFGEVDKVRATPYLK